MHRKCSAVLALRPPKSPLFPYTTLFRSAESLLRNGIAAAKTFFTDSDVYTGFTVAVAQGVEPSLSWQLGTAAAASDEDTSDLKSDGDNVFRLLLERKSGTLFCIAENEAA